MRQLRPETGESHEKFKNYSQLPNFLCSYYFLITLISFQGTQSSILLIKFFWIRRWVFQGKLSSVETSTSWNRGIHCKKFKLTNNYLMFYFIIICKNFLIISWSTEFDIWFIKDSFWVRGEAPWGKCWSLKQIYPVKGESLAKFKNYSQLNNTFLNYHFLMNFPIISSLKELIFDLFKVFLD